MKTDNQPKHTEGEWYYYDSNRGMYGAGQWIQFQLATRLSKKELDTKSIGKISFTGLGGRNKKDYEEAEANAQRIVKAVNLLSFIEKDVKRLRNTELDDLSDYGKDKMIILEELLKQAESK